jgi:hypothetical protein
VHINSTSKGQRRKGRPLPTSHEISRGGIDMKVFGALFLLIGLLAENTPVIATSIFILFVGVMFEK